MRYTPAGIGAQEHGSPNPNTNVSDAAHIASLSLNPHFTDWPLIYVGATSVDCHLKQGHRQGRTVLILEKLQ